MCQWLHVLHCLDRGHESRYCGADRRGKTPPHWWSLVSICCLLGSSFPGGTSDKEPVSQCRRCRRLKFDSWVRKIPWRGAWQPTPIFLPGESQGQRSLVGYSLWGHKELDVTAETYMHTCLLGSESWCLMQARWLSFPELRVQETRRQRETLSAWGTPHLAQCVSHKVTTSSTHAGRMILWPVVLFYVCEAWSWQKLFFLCFSVVF